MNDPSPTIQTITPAPRQAPLDQSPTIGKLAAALAKAQLVMESAKKDATNPHLKNRYADLTSCWAACRKPLGENGLSVAQLTKSVSPDLVKIVSVLLHESGEWIRSELTVPAGGNKGVNAAQAMGSAISYGRRYGLSALVGISTDDDDGTASGMPQGQQQARQQTTQAPRQQQPPRQAPQGQPQGNDTATEKQTRAIHAICGKKQVDPHAFASQTLGREIESLKEITKREAGQIIDALNGSQAQGPQYPQEDAPF
jgi:hypothetical protein